MSKHVFTVFPFYFGFETFLRTRSQYFKIAWFLTKDIICPGDWNNTTTVDWQ